MLDLISYYIEFGTGEFATISWLMSLYFLFRYIFCALGHVFYKRDISKDIKFFKSAIILYVIFLLFLLVFGFAMGTLEANTSPEKISYYNNLFINFDKSVFGVHLPFWFQDIKNPLKPVFDFLSFPILFVYMNIAVVLGFIFLFSLIKGEKVFYRLILSFALVLTIGVPLWGIFPATPPFDAYYDNVNNLEVPKNVEVSMSTYQPNPTLASFYDGIKKLNLKYKNFYAITTMPSMHIAWSVLILYFGFIFWRPLMVVLVPYFILNATATIFILQHYTIDIPAGFLVGVVSIWLAGIIAKKTKTPEIIKNLAETVQGDIREIKSLILRVK